MKTNEHVAAAAWGTKIKIGAKRDLQRAWEENLESVILFLEGAGEQEFYNQFSAKLTGPLNGKRIASLTNGAGTSRYTRVKE